jgi:uncharacterized membrane protein YfcA
VLGLTPWEFLLGIFAMAIVAGFYGSLLGLGGGLVIVPALVIIFGVDVHLAIAASLVSILATSSGSAARYTAQHLVHLRLGMFLEVATAAGGLVGAILTGLVLVTAQGTQILLLAFVPVTLAAVWLMYRRGGNPRIAPGEHDPLCDRLGLRGSYLDRTTGETVPFRAVRGKEGLLLSFAAGAVSGLLGVGGGIFKVPAMNAIMRIPLRVATATSSLMIGVTATAGSLVFLARGDIAPLIVGPVALGTLTGTFVGVHVQGRSRTETLKSAFVIVLLLAATSMALEGLGWLHV